MARIKVPITVIDPLGSAVGGASVRVQRRSDGVDVTLYTAETGPTTTANPTTTDSYGRTQAWVDTGLSYNAIISGTGITTYTQAFEGGGDVTRRESHGWAIAGEIKVPVGDVDFIPGFFAAKGAGETLTLKKLRARINSGTSVTIKVQINGADVSGYTGLVVNNTTTGQDFAPGDVSISNDDRINIVVTAVAGTPKNLAVTAVFERAT